MFTEKSLTYIVVAVGFCFERISIAFRFETPAPRLLVNSSEFESLSASTRSVDPFNDWAAS